MKNTKRLQSNLLTQCVYARDLYSFPNFSTPPSTRQYSDKKYINLVPQTVEDGVKIVPTLEEYEITPESVRSHLSDVLTAINDVSTASKKNGGDFAVLQQLPRSGSELRQLLSALQNISENTEKTSLPPITPNNLSEEEK